MPTGHEYSSDVKSIIFRVIKFVEAEKLGAIIPLYNVNDRLINMLGISHGSLVSLKKELMTTIEEEEESVKHLRSSVGTHDKVRRQKPISPKKLGHSGRLSVVLSEDGNSLIRLIFHTLLSERQYPTLRRILKRLQHDAPDFPINNIATLSKNLKQLGYVYRRTSSVKLPLDSTYAIAERARYFNRLSLLEEANAEIYFQDETWCNANEEKTNLWIESSTGAGRFRTTTGKGKKIVLN